MSKKIITLFLGFLIILFMIEILLRVFPSKFTDFNSSLQYVTEKYLDSNDIGRLRPNQTASWNRECFRIFPIRTNSLGFRDLEWNQQAGFKIAVIGSSNIDAISVAEGESTAGILKKITEAETLNLAVSGYNTITKLLAYKKYARPFSPELVLFFFDDGDINENSCDLRDNATSYRYRQCALVEEGKIKITTPRPRTPIGNDTQRNILIKLRSLVSRYCKLCIFIKRLGRYKIFGSSPPTKTNSQKAAGIVNQSGQDQADGWFLFDFFLKQLKNELKKDGAKLVVVNIPGSSGKKLKEITEKNNIYLINLEEGFKKYKKVFNIKAPYFSYRCYSQWNPLGHFLAANLISRYLLENDLVPKEMNKSLVLARIEKNLSRSPKAILGEKAYREIYQGGIFLGKTNIKALMEQLN